jgi:hypothetical protein
MGKSDHELISRYYPGTPLDGQKKTAVILNQDSECPD